MKRIFACLVALMMVLMAAGAFAETKIAVNGSGEVRISADTAVISLGINARDKDVLNAQQKVNECIAAIRGALIEKGVKEENINTDYMNIYPIYDYQNDQEQLSAYNASTTLAIRVTDMESVGSLIDAAFAAGANTLNGISFSASDTEEAKAEAMKKAVQDARKKAEILAEASGLKLASIEQITEGGTFSYDNNIGNIYSKAAGFDIGMETEEAKAGTVVQAAKLVVSAAVSITFNAE